MAAEFNIPGKIISGSGALEKAEPILKTYGKKPLLVTDPMMIQLGNSAKVEQALKNQGIEYAIYSNITGEPTDTMVDEGLAVYQNEKCDFIIALGGGSVIDTMKAIGVTAVGGGSIDDYMGKQIDVEMPKMVAIPTTAGTGSEATQVLVISNTKQNIKMMMKSACLIPTMAVIDPQFTMTAPPKITANTGLDALCHSMEAYTSRLNQPLSDTFALSAIGRIFKYLPIAFHDGSNEEARVQMSIAALEAGIAFNNASVTVIHGMSRPIGALYHVPHGLSNAMLIKVCMSFALDGAYDRFAVLGRTIGAASADDSDEIAAKKYLDALLKLVEELEVPTFEEYGIDKDDFFSKIDKMSKDAVDSGSPANTIKEVTIEDVKQMYKDLWK